jgi:hypothetical protein
LGTFEPVGKTFLSVSVGWVLLLLKISTTVECIGTSKVVPAKTFYPGSNLGKNAFMTTVPAMGWGCFQLKGDVAKTSLKSALQAGFRLIDTATCYRNEADIGVALRESEESLGIRREDVFITSKIAPG